MRTLTSLSAVLVYTAIKATVLLAVACAAGWLLRQRSASARHMMRAFVMAALLLLPFSGRLLPAWNVKAIPEFMPARSVANRTAINSPAASAPTAAFQIENPVVTPSSAVRPAASSASVSHPVRDGARTVAQAVHTRPSLEVPTWRAIGTSASPAAVAPSPLFADSSIPSRFTFALSWLQILSLTWLLGFLLFAIHWLTGVFRVARLVRRANPLSDQSWTSMLTVWRGSSASVAALPCA